jgi:hypothetical protein
VEQRGSEFVERGRRAREGGSPPHAAGSLSPARTSSTSLSYASARSSYTAKPMSLRFLRDGARAIRAFCRPYPVKVVGVPVDIDIGKTSLRVKVRVTP